MRQTAPLNLEESLEMTINYIQSYFSKSRITAAVSKLMCREKCEVKLLSVRVFDS